MLLALGPQHATEILGLDQPVVLHLLVQRNTRLEISAKMHSVNNDKFSFRAWVTPTYDAASTWAYEGKKVTNDLVSAAVNVTFGPDNFDHTVKPSSLPGSGGTFFKVKAVWQLDCITPGTGDECQIVLDKVYQCDGSESCPTPTQLESTNATTSTYYEYHAQP